MADMDTPTAHTAIAAQVRAALATAGISEKLAAERTRIPRTTLQRRLAGDSPLTVTELASLASLLGYDDFTTMLRQFTDVSAA